MSGKFDCTVSKCKSKSKFKFQTPYDLLNHLNLHKDRNEYLDIVDEIEKDLKKYYKSHECDTCNLHFRSTKDLYQHLNEPCDCKKVLDKRRRKNNYYNDDDNNNDIKNQLPSFDYENHVFSQLEEKIQIVKEQIDESSSSDDMQTISNIPKKSDDMQTISNIPKKSDDTQMISYLPKKNGNTQTISNIPKKDVTVDCMKQHITIKDITFTFEDVGTIVAEFNKILPIDNQMILARTLNGIPTIVADITNDLPHVISKNITFINNIGNEQIDFVLDYLIHDKNLCMVNKICTLGESGYPTIINDTTLSNFDLFYEIVITIYGMIHLDEYHPENHNLYVIDKEGKKCCWKYSNYWTLVKDKEPNQFWNTILIQILADILTIIEELCSKQFDTAKTARLKHAIDIIYCFYIIIDRDKLINMLCDVICANNEMLKKTYNTTKSLKKHIIQNEKPQKGYLHKQYIAYKQKIEDLRKTEQLTIIYNYKDIN
jgi:hypothetical protein